jgi:hypothetical protein
MLLTGQSWLLAQTDFGIIGTKLTFAMLIKFCLRMATLLIILSLSLTMMLLTVARIPSKVNYLTDLMVMMSTPDVRLITEVLT